MPDSYRTRPERGSKARVSGKPPSLDAAIWAAERGHAVVMMVPVKAGQRKRAAEKWKHLGYRTTDELRRIWPSGVGTAILTGPSGLVDIDLDTVDGWPEGEGELAAIADWRDIPSTMEVTTPTGGRHLAFQAGGVAYKTCSGEVADDIDVRGRGGLFVIHSGNPRRPYMITDTREPVELPDWLADVLPLAGSRSSASSPNGDGLVIDIQDLLENGVAPGKQEYVLYRLIWRLRNDGVSRESAYIIWSNILARSVTGVDAKGNKRPEWTQADFDGKWDGADEKVGPIERDLAGMPTSSEIREQREGDFWDAREMLSLIWDWAKARRVAPDALLTEFLSGVVCHVPPNLLLPGIIGGRGTLSALFALSGPSGAGKGSAARAARDAIQWEKSLGLGYVRFPLGTGEGMTKKFGFKHYDKGSDRHELVRTAHCAIIDIKDIDTLASLQTRGGSITITELTKFYSGEELGASYSDPKHVTIPEYTYHGCLIAGVQPARSSIILDGWDSGFPQRWAWFEAVDKHMPDERPDEPERIIWNLPEEICDLGPDDDLFEFDVCGEVCRIIDKGRVEDQRAGKDDGHQRFTQEKIAAQLALLDGRVDLSKEDWDLAESRMRKSARLKLKRAKLSLVVRQGPIVNAVGVRAYAGPSRMIPPSVTTNRVFAETSLSMPQTGSEKIS